MIKFIFLFPAEYIGQTKTKSDFVNALENDFLSDLNPGISMWFKYSYNFSVQINFSYSFQN